MERTRCDTYTCTAVEMRALLCSMCVLYRGARCVCASVNERTCTLTSSSPPLPPHTPSSLLQAVQFRLGTQGMYGASYVQAITPNLCLGGECTYMGQQGMLDIKYSGRYSTPAFTAIATVQGAGAEALGWGVDMQYARKVSQKVNLAAELKYGISSGESEVR